MVDDQSIIEPRVFLNPFIPHDPFRQQIDFLSLTEEEAFYGGQAGGGKSDALLMASLMYVDTPDYSALLLRRTLKEHKKKNALIDRAHRWLDPLEKKGLCHWNGGDLYWEWPNGARLEFGYLATDSDLMNYDGPEYQFIGFDELTQFTEYHYVSMMGRLRRLKGEEIPLRIRGASNPGGIGHKWVKDRFINGEYTFIPSTYKDNPYIDQERYGATLDKLPYVLRKQKKEGNWDIGTESGLFNRLWFNWVQEIPYKKIKEVVRYWDLAATEFIGDNNPDYTVGTLAARLDDQRMGFYDSVRVRWSPYKVDDLMLRTTIADYEKYGGKYTIWIEQESGGMAKRDANQITRNLAGYPVKIEKVSTNKVERATGYSAYVEAGNVDVLDRKWADAFIEEHDYFPDNVDHDDQVDSASGCFRALFPPKKQYRPMVAIVDLTEGL